MKVSTVLEDEQTAKAVFRQHLKNCADRFVADVCRDHPDWSDEFRNGFTFGIREATAVYTEILEKR